MRGEEKSTRESEKRREKLDRETRSGGGIKKIQQESVNRGQERDVVMR